MYRTHTCNDLRITHQGLHVSLSGWVQRLRKFGGMTFIDLRDRYGITQLVVEENAPTDLRLAVDSLGREFVIQAKGEVVERSNKNSKMATGDIELSLSEIRILNRAQTPPFTIEDETDGGEEIRAIYRYLDLRRNPLKRAIMLRHVMAQEVRNYLSGQHFLEIETPVLIKSTPEGARDFVVPSRMNLGQFYALPQSPQTFKQLLMVAGYDRYFQIVRCFRDEDLRADRQPEFTQIDCEMAFVEREDVLNTFEGLAKHLFQSVLCNYLGHEPHPRFSQPFPRLSYADSIRFYGTDKPDIRFEMKICDLTPHAKGHGFALFDAADYIGAINAKGAGAYTRKQLDELTEWVKRPQIGAKGLVYARVTSEGVKSSVDKFYTPELLQRWADCAGAVEGDLLLILCGEERKTQTMLGTLRIEMGNRLGLRKKDDFAALWVYDFPLLEWDEEAQRFQAMHHPFTSPKPQDLDKFYSNKKEELEQVSANAYDFVLNGVEIGGGSIRIHDSAVQERMFEVLGFSQADADYRFGFIINAFKYGAPPHGGIAFGFDRWCSVFGGSESIRDYIAFPKNNSGRDMMLDAPSYIDDVQMKELALTSTATPRNEAKN